MSALTDRPVTFEVNNRDGEVTANVTYIAAYSVAIGDSATNKGIAKGDKHAGEVDRSGDQYMGLDPDSVALAEGGFAIQKDMNLISRSVASYEVSRLLQSPVIAAESYGLSNDGSQVGVSAFVSGVSATKDGASKVHDIDYSNPVTQKGLHDLEAIDYLTGQIDRHTGNIFVDPATGQVSGIDNDLCLGSQAVATSLEVDPVLATKVVGNPPHFYSAEMAAQIEALTPNQLRSTLENVSDPNGNHRLDQAEINNAVERLQQLKSSVALARADGRVIENFNANTLTTALQQQIAVAGNDRVQSTGNYLGRSHQDKQFAVNGDKELITPAAAPAPSAFTTRLVAAQNALRNAETAAATNLANPAVQNVHQLEASLRNQRDGIQAILTSPAAQQDLATLRAGIAQEYQTSAAELDNLKDFRYEATTPITPAKQALILQHTGHNVVVGAGVDPQIAGEISRIATRKLALNGVFESQAQFAAGEQYLRTHAGPQLQQMEVLANQLQQAKEALKADIDQNPDVVAARKKLEMVSNVRVASTLSRVEAKVERQEAAPDNSIRARLYAAKTDVRTTLGINDEQKLAKVQAQKATREDHLDLLKARVQYFNNNPDQVGPSGVDLAKLQRRLDRCEQKLQELEKKEFKLEQKLELRQSIRQAKAAPAHGAGIGH